MNKIKETYTRLMYKALKVSCKFMSKEDTRKIVEYIASYIEDGIRPAVIHESIALFPHYFSCGELMALAINDFYTTPLGMEVKGLFKEYIYG